MAERRGKWAHSDSRIAAADAEQDRKANEARYRREAVRYLADTGEHRAGIFVEPRPRGRLIE